MTFDVQNPGLAWLAALLVVPPLLHLFARARPPRYPFSSVALVLRIVRHTMRLKRPKDWMLLACRTLLFAGLVLLFLRPLLFRSWHAARRGARRDLVVVVDRSASMAWTEGGRSRFAAACAEADGVLGDLSSQDLADIVWLDAEPDAVFPELGENAAYLRGVLSKTRVTSEAGDPMAAVELALSILAAGSGVPELCIVSDFQASQWKDVALPVPEGVQVYYLSPAGDEAANGALLDIRTKPEHPLVGEPAQVVCEVGNFSAKPRSRTITVEIGERRVEREVMLEAWGRASVAVGHVFPEPGTFVLQARLDEDPFGRDDWRASQVPVRDVLRVGIHGAAPHVAPVWRRALEALPWTEPRNVSREDLAAPTDLDLLLIAGWRGAGLEHLGSRRAEGLPVICAPARDTDGAALWQLAGREPSAVPGKVRHEELKEELSTRIADADDAVFDLFRDGSYGDPAAASYRQRLVLPLQGLEGAPILDYADGVPALFRCRADTPLVYWSMPLEPGTGDWAARSTFLPFFGELLNSVRSRRHGLLPSQELPGNPLTRLVPLQHEDVALRDEHDAPVEVSIVATGLEGRRFVSAPVPAPGLYHWRTGAGNGAVQVVNFPPRESDLRTGPPPVRGEGSGRSLKHGMDLDAAHRGIPLWRYCLWAALALVAIEMLLILWADFDVRKLSG